MCYYYNILQIITSAVLCPNFFHLGIQIWHHLENGTLSTGKR
jgi:hypothetical protein